MRTFDEEQVSGARRRAGSEHRAAKESHASERDPSGGVGRPKAPNHVLSLQRTAGNAAVAHLLAEDERGAEVKDVVGKGGGQTLPSGSRAQMESAFGEDFSSVRVHSGPEADSSARSVQAKAYTVGDEIVLGSDVSSLESAEGQRTLAHELTHVVQQRSGPVEGTPSGGGISISDPSDRFETEAENVAERIGSEGAQPASAAQSRTDGAVGSDVGLAAAAGVSVQREGDEEDETETEDENGLD